jgi:hypothetical protein
VKNILEWERQLTMFIGEKVKNAEEQNEVYSVKFGISLLFLTKVLKEKLIKNNLSMWCAFQYMGMEQTDTKNLISTIIFLENKDHIHVVADENKEIKAIHCSVFENGGEKIVSLNDFSEKSDNHGNLRKFIQKEFIDEAKNRLEFITGAKII